MDKKIKTVAKNLSFSHRSLGEGGPILKEVFERLTPLLILATTFIWLWR